MRAEKAAALAAAEKAAAELAEKKLATAQAADSARAATATPQQTHSEEAVLVKKDAEGTVTTKEAEAKIREAATAAIQVPSRLTRSSASLWARRFGATGYRAEEEAEEGGGAAAFEHDHREAG